MPKVGRPTVENPRNLQIRINVNDKEKSAITELAKRMKMSKSRLTRNVLLGNLNDTDFLLKVHTLPLIKNLTELKRRFKDI